MGNGILNSGNNKKISETPRSKNFNVIQDDGVVSNAPGVVFKRSTPEQVNNE